MPSRVIVRVPASTANLGPGFDCLGLALCLYNTVEFTWQKAGNGLQVEIDGEGATILPRDSSNLIARAADDVWQAVGRSPISLQIRATNGVPLGSGLGSSAAAIVGGLVAANALIDGQLSRDDLLRLAYKLEPSADNAAASLFGGLTIVSATADELMHAPIDIPPTKVIIVQPELRLSTLEAREVLPGHVPLADAIFNISRSAFVVRALQLGDYNMLGWAMADRLHQPYRKRLVPGYDGVVQAARMAGAAAVALSGAGPSMAAFAVNKHWEVAEAMRRAFALAGLHSRAFVLPVDRQGVQISVVE